MRLNIPRLGGMAQSIVLARNHEFATPSEILGEGDEVALLPPVSGGSSLSAKASATVSAKSNTREITFPEGHFFVLTRAAIDARAAEERLVQGFDGAVVTFHGVVRNNTRGRATLRLEYECYEEMAIRMMAEIGRQIAGEFAVSRIAMIHRLGIMEIGEASVLVVATAPHRRPAFEAALEGINRLKRLVPIWKKEFFEDGEVWVEGEVGRQCASRFSCVAACCWRAAPKPGLRPRLWSRTTRRSASTCAWWRILATVKDDSGTLVGSLNKEDFAVRDNGAPQQVAVFERQTDQPLSVAVLIDNSGSTAKDLRYETDSVTRFVRALLREGNPLDAVALYSFNWEIVRQNGFAPQRDRD